MRVIVIGAGLAGLQAALDLEEAGREVVLLEARRRPGGRVFSTALENGAVVELGGEWIQAQDRTLRALAARLGVPLAPVGVDFMRRAVVGGPAVAAAEQEETERTVARALSRLDARAIASLTLGEFLESLELDQAQRLLLRARLQGSCGADPGRIALRSFGGGFATGGSGPYLRVAAGNLSLAEAMARRLHTLRLRHEAREVEQDERGVKVRGLVSAGRFEMTAEAAVVALPAAVLAKVAFRPPLPDAVAGAIRELPMGVASKLAVATEVPPPLRAIQDVEVPYWCWTGLGPDDRASAALTAFAGSPQAQAALATASGDPEPWLARLRAANPDLSLRGPARLVNWALDPHARGCYSAFDNASWDRAALLSRPIGRLAFAGEHTAGHDTGTMEGALRSGQRAARELLSLGS